MRTGARASAVYRIHVLTAALLLATAALLLVSFVETENTASAQSALSGGSAPTCDGGSLDLNAYEMRTYELHNQVRESNNLAALCVSEVLTQAARSHSQEMIDQGHYSHSSHNGESFSARLERFGYDSYKEIGENIAWGSGSLASPENIFEGWIESSNHRNNILGPGYREVGIGTATGACEGYSDCTMYTVDFGVLQSPAPKARNKNDSPRVTNAVQEEAETSRLTNSLQDRNDILQNVYQYILRLLHSLGF